MFFKAHGLAAILAVGWLIGAWFYLQTPQEIIAEKIVASQEPELAEPVYAQFAYTQLLSLPELHRITRVVLPIYAPMSGSSLVVQLWRNETLIQVWQPSLTSTGTFDLTLPLSTPQLMDGMLAVRISAPDIEASSRNQAPRIFIEKDDTAYAAGHYRVANNDKRGDIGLTLWEVTTNGQILREKLASREAMLTLARCIFWIALALLSLQIPYVLSQFFRARPV